MTSLFGDIVAGIGSFISSVTNDDTPGQNGNPLYPTPDGRPIEDSSSSSTDYGKIFTTIGGIVQTGLKLTAPLINAQVTKPNEAKYPELSDATKNDPRFQALFGGYGGGVNAPYTKEPSSFQLAFPGILKNLLADNGTSPTPLQDLQKKETATTPTSTPLAPSTEAAAAPSPLSGGKEAPTTSPTRGIGAGSAAQRIAKYDDLINESAAYHKVPVDLIKAVIEQESGGKPDAVRVEKDGRQSTGLMQILDPTAKALGIENHRETLKDPGLAIDTGTKLLGQLITQFGDSDGTYARVIRAYNAGQGNEASGKTQDPSSRSYISNKYYRDVARRRKAYGSSGT